MAVPIYDTASVVLIRLRQRRSPFVGDKSHFSHRLVNLGMTKPQAVLTIYLATATCGLGALLLHQVDSIGAILILLLVACTLLLVGVLESTGGEGNEQGAAGEQGAGSTKHGAVEQRSLFLCIAILICSLTSHAKSPKNSRNSPAAVRAANRRIPSAAGCSRA